MSCKLEQKMFYEKIFKDSLDKSWESAPGKKVLINYIDYLFNNKKITQSSKIMDIGCGNGFLLNKIHELFNIGKENLYGIDISDIAIEIAKKEYGLNNLIAMDVNKYSKDSKFNLVFSYESLEHVIDSEKLFNVITRILEISGIFIFMIPTLGYYRVDREDEGWYEDLDINKQLQWNRYRKHWEEFFGGNNLKLMDVNESIKFGAIKPGNFYFGKKVR